MDSVLADTELVHLRWALECAETGVWEFDQFSGDVRFSPEYYTILGYAPNAFPAAYEAWHELVHGDDLPAVVNALAEYRDGRRAHHSLCYRMRDASGEWRWIHSRGGTVRGRPNCLVGTHVDITGQRRLEERLRGAEGEMRARMKAGERELAAMRRRLHFEGDMRRAADEQGALLAEAISQAPVSILITDSEGRLIQANPYFYRNSGWSKDEVVGQDLGFLGSGVHPPDFYQQLWATVQGGSEWRGEFCNRRRDGTLYWEAAAISPVRDATGRITHFVSVQDDITAIKAAARERAELLARIDQGERLAAIGHAVAGAAHCIRNILTAISGGSQLLDAGCAAGNWDTIAQARRIIGRSARRLSMLVIEMVDYSKDRPLDAAPCAVAPLLRDVAEDCARFAENAHVGLETDTAGAPSEWTLDAHAITRALTNLAVNAIEAMPAGGNLRLAASMDDGRLRLDVADTGCGIPPQEQRRVFDPYFSTKGARGTGLGLAIVRDVVAKHGGEIRLESAPGEGTTFTILLPAPGVSQTVDEVNKGADAPCG